LLLNLGLAYVKQDDYTQAKPLFARVEKSPLAGAQSRQLLAACELFTGNPAKAIALTSTLPRSPEVLFLAGTAHLRLKQKTEAKAAFDELLTSAPPAQAHLLMGRAYSDSALFPEAAAELALSLEADPGSLATQFELAKVRIGLREFGEAEKLLRAILSARPAYEDAAYYLGALLVLGSREKEAIPYLEQARAARSNEWGASYYLGRAFLQTAQPVKALPLLQAASKANPDEAAVWFQLARAYQAAGRAAEAAASRNQYRRLRDTLIEQAQQVLAPGR